MKDNLANVLALFERGQTEDAYRRLRDLVETHEEDEATIDRADREWSNDNLIVDHDAVVSYSDGGAWVSAWVYVDRPEAPNTCNKEQP